MTTKELVDKLLEVYKTADEERLQRTNEAQQEAEKWKSEDDMYGWNFHMGLAGGITSGSIYFYRVRRLLEEIRKEL